MSEQGAMVVLEGVSKAYGKGEVASQRHVREAALELGRKLASGASEGGPRSSRP